MDNHHRFGRLLLLPQYLFKHFRRLVFHISTRIFEPCLTFSLFTWTTWKKFHSGPYVRTVGLHSRGSGLGIEAGRDNINFFLLNSFLSFFFFKNNQVQSRPCQPTLKPENDIKVTKFLVTHNDVEIIMDPPTFSLFPSNYSNILSLCQKRQKEAFSKEVPKKSRKKRIQNLTSDKTEISRRIFFENHGNQNKSRLPFR